MIPPADVAGLLAAFRAKPADLGVGLFNPLTGELRLGSFDTVAGRKGHEGLAQALGIADTQEWRGFSIDSAGRFSTLSHFNLPDGSLALPPDAETRVRDALLQVGLIH